MLLKRNSFRPFTEGLAPTAEKMSLMLFCYFLSNNSLVNNTRSEWSVAAVDIP